jgi:hypothetical protein
VREAQITEVSLGTRVLLLGKLDQKLCWTFVNFCHQNLICATHVYSQNLIHLVIYLCKPITQIDKNVTNNKNASLLLYTYILYINLLNSVEM